MEDLGFEGLGFRDLGLFGLESVGCSGFRVLRVFCLGLGGFGA